MGIASYLRRLTVVLAFAAGSSFAAFASGPYDPVPPGIPETLASLADQPATHTGVVFDRSMMQMAQDVLEQGGLPPQRAAAALTSISFDTSDLPEDKLKEQKPKK